MSKPHIVRRNDRWWIWYGPGLGFNYITLKGAINYINRYAGVTP